MKKPSALRLRSGQVAPKEKKKCLMCGKPAKYQYNSWAWYCGPCLDHLEDAIDENKQGGSQSDD